MLEIDLSIMNFERDPEKLKRIKQHLRKKEISQLYIELFYRLTTSEEIEKIQKKYYKELELFKLGRKIASYMVNLCELEDSLFSELILKGEDEKTKEKLKLILCLEVVGNKGLNKEIRKKMWKNNSKC